MASTIPSTSSLVYNDEPVLNSNVIASEINSLTGSKFLTCMLCFEDVNPLYVGTPCGHCDNLVCNDCITIWYGNIVLGGHINSSYVSCPFCKKRPKGTILSKFNKQSCLIKGLKNFDFLSTIYYGWCLECYTIKEWMTRECGNTIIPTGQFTCEECEIIKEEKEQEEERVRLALLGGFEYNEDDLNLRYCRVKICPHCEVAVMKISGCDHITCQCGTHFCWICLGIYEHDIYPHLEGHYGIYY